MLAIIYSVFFAQLLATSQAAVRFSTSQKSTIQPLTSQQADTSLPLSPHSTSRPDPPMLVRKGLPPIPSTVVGRKQAGLFVEMFELLPDTLTSTDYNIATEQGVTRKPKHRDLSILEWAQTFAVYMAVLSQTAPQRVVDLLGYQQQINNRL